MNCIISQCFCLVISVDSLDVYGWFLFIIFQKIAIWITYYLITTNRCGYLKVTVNYHHRGEYTLAVAVHAVLTVFVLFSLDFGSLFLSLMQLSIIFFLLKISQPLWLQVFGTHKQSPGVYSVNVWRRRHTCVRGLLFFSSSFRQEKVPLALALCQWPCCSVPVCFQNKQGEAVQLEPGMREKCNTQSTTFFLY